MGLYVFECQNPGCAHQEEHVYCSWRMRPDEIKCEKCGSESKHIIAPHCSDNHPIRGLLEDCSWLDSHAQVVSQEHYEGVKGNKRYEKSVIRTRKEFKEAMAAKGIREKASIGNRTEI